MVLNFELLALRIMVGTHVVELVVCRICDTYRAIILHIKSGK